MQELLYSEGIEVGVKVTVPSDPYLRQRAALADTPTRESDLKDVLGLREAGGRPRRAVADKFLR